MRNGAGGGVPVESDDASSFGVACVTAAIDEDDGHPESVETVTASESEGFRGNFDPRDEALVSGGGATCAEAEASTSPLHTASPWCAGGSRPPSFAPPSTP